MAMRCCPVPISWKPSSRRWLFVGGIMAPNEERCCAMRLRILFQALALSLAGHMSLIFTGTPLSTTMYTAFGPSRTEATLHHLGYHFPIDACCRAAH